MSLEVRWTEEAEFTFDHIVSFIEDQWGEKSSEKFINKTKNYCQVYPLTLSYSPNLIL